MRITITSVMVDDQARALEFYTDKLGFEVRTDVSLGEYRWLTVGSPEQPGGIELLLEPTAHPAATPFQRALYDDGVPFTSFTVDDVRVEHERLAALGVRFHVEPTEHPWGVLAVLDDTCGNLIQIQQVHVQS
jgi:catechol 2,3-dioxygenase-like lactoylglutathione lyase family enzyme